MEKIPSFPTPPNVLDYYSQCNQAEDEGRPKPRPSADVIEYLNIKGYKKQFAEIDNSKGKTSYKYDIEAYTEEIRYHLAQTHPDIQNKVFIVGKYVPKYFEDTQIFQHALSVRNININKAYELYKLGGSMSLYASACGFLSDYKRTSEYVQSVASLTIDIDYSGYRFYS